MFTRVLLPTDLSTRPVALAVDPASLQQLGVEDLVLLNVIEVGPQIGFASDTFERVAAWRNDAERALNEQKARIEACGVRCRWRLELGDPAAETLRVAYEEGVSLVVIRTHGHGRLRRLLRRSITRSILGRTEVPVLVVPARPKVAAGVGRLDGLVQTVVLVTDSSESSRSAVALVKRLPTTQVSQVVLMLARERGTPDDSRAEGLLDHIRVELEFFGFNVRCLEQEGRYASVPDPCRQTPASLIVIGSDPAHDRGCRRAGILAQVIRRPVGPVLVVPRMSGSAVVGNLAK